jgi:hypothetical protein
MATQSRQLCAGEAELRHPTATIPVAAVGKLPIIRRKYRNPAEPPRTTRNRHQFDVSASNPEAAVLRVAVRTVGYSA